MAFLSMLMPSSTTTTNNPNTATAISNLKQSSTPISPSPSPSSSSPASTVKPCCVCKNEKAIRDECMLFSTSADPQKDCAATIDKYRSCMEGFGFKLP